MFLMLWGKEMFPTYLLMKLQSYVKSIQEEEPEKGKEISLKKQLSQQPRVYQEPSLEAC